MLHNFKQNISVIALAVLMGSLFLQPKAASAQTREVVIKAGTPIEAVTLYDISSRKYQSGSIVELKLLNPVQVKGEVVIPSGSIIKARVSQAQKSGAFGKAGMISIDATTLTAADGTLVPISGLTFRDEGKGRAFWAIATGLTCLPLLGFLIHGQQGVIPAGTQLSGNVMANTTVTVEAADE